MKLVFVTDNGFSSKGDYYYYNGANIQHYNTVTNFFDEIVFIARNSAYELSSNKISIKYKTYLVDSITSGKRILKNYLGLNNILEAEIRDADVVMCFGLNGYMASKKAEKYNKPVIAYVGGCVYDTLINMDSRFKQKTAPIMKKIISKMVKNADYVHYVDEYLLERYPTKGEYLICPSARIKISEKALSKRLEKINSKNTKITLGIIGYTHNKIKGMDTAIRALDLLGADYSLEIVGRGDHSWLDVIAEDLGVQDRLRFLGVLEGRDQIFEWIDSLDIYLQPSLTEGMPRATIEAMSRACPVVSTRVGGLKNIIEERYQINIDDYDSLANKISTLGNNTAAMLESAVLNFKKCKKFDSTILDLKRNEFYSKIIKSFEL